MINLYIDIGEEIMQKYGLQNNCPIAYPKQVNRLIRMKSHANI